MKTSLYFVLMLGIAGCGDAAQNASPKSVDLEAVDESRPFIGSPEVDSRLIALPSKYVFDERLKVEVAGSWESRLSTMSEKDQAMLRAVSARYFDALVFSSVEEQRELAGTGFPMPEEWVASSMLTDAELKELARRGNLKAAMFYSDRLANQLALLQSRAGAAAQGEYDVQRQLNLVIAEALGSGAQLMRATDSPFAAYVYGRSLSGATQGVRPEAMGGAFFAARDRGDTRAPRLMAAFSRQNQNMNNQTIMSAYSAMKTLSSN